MRSRITTCCEAKAVAFYYDSTLADGNFGIKCLPEHEAVALRSIKNLSDQNYEESHVQKGSILPAVDFDRH